MAVDFEAIKEAAGWVTAALFGGAVGLQRLMRFTANNNAGIEHAKADESLVKGLRVELERLGEQNGKLAESLNSLQSKIMQLNTEVGKLQGENTRQAREITDLHEENSRLRDQIATLQVEIMVMRNEASN
jgi:chromosome segregation ATPase